MHQYNAALVLINTLLAELERLDDKLILRGAFAWDKVVIIPKYMVPYDNQTALTSARTAANSICFPPSHHPPREGKGLHGRIQLLSGYFFQAVGSLSTHGESDAPGGGQALGALKYMLLCMVMLHLPKGVNSLLMINLAARDARRGEYAQLSSDPTIRSHLAALYDTLLEQNLLRIVEAYIVVEVAYVAECVGQEVQGVEAKLSQMILDKVLYGVLDQGRGCLLVYGQPEADNTYGAAIDTLVQVSKVVQSLYDKTVKIA